MKTRLYRVVCLILSAVFVIGALLTSCSTEKKKSETVDYLQKIIEKTFSNDAPELTPENTRTEVIFKPTASMPVQGLDSVKLVSYSGTSFESVLLGEAIYQGEKTDISVYSGGTSFIVGSSLFGNTKYGLEADDLETLISSIYGEYAGGYGYDEEDYGYGSSAQDPADILSEINNIISLIEAQFGETIVSLSEKYLDIFSDAASRATENKVDVEGNITVTVSFNTDCAKKMIKDVFNEAKKDKELKGLITDLCVLMGMDESAAKAQIDAFFSNDDFLNAVYDGLESTPFSIEVIVKADLEYNLTALSFAFNLSDGTKIKTFFDVSNVNNMKFGYSVEAFDDDFGASVKNGIEYTISSSTDKDVTRIDVAATVFSYGFEESIDLYSVSYNNANGAYTVSSKFIGEQLTWIEGASFAVSGVISAEEKKTVMTVTGIELADNTYAADITLIEETGVTLPKFPTDFKGILDITEEDINEIMESAVSNPLVAKIAELIEYYSSFEEDYEEDYYEDFEYPEFDF